MNRTVSVCAFILAIALATASHLHAAFPTLTLKPVSLDQLTSPTTIANAGDGSGRLFVTEQRGRIRIIQNGMLLPTPFLNLSAKLVTEQVGFDERGVIGLAFHPGYGDSGSPGYRRFYVFYTAPPPVPANGVNCRSIIAEFLVSLADPNVADIASERILLTINKPQFNHNGGQLEFGPDGFLYIATGDGGSSNDNNVGHTGGAAASPRPTNGLGNSQDRTNLLGDILRIDPLGNNGPGGQYGIPASNPFVGLGGAIREEIFAYGLRNPWRFSFDNDPGGTRMFCADVGQGRIEEVNLITAGGNYGWRYLEGTEMPTFSSGAVAPNIPMPHPGGTLIMPIAMYAHPGVTYGTPPLPQLGVSITGGYCYRGAAIPALQGKYVFADYSFDTSLPRGIMLGIEETSPGVWSPVNVLTLTNGNPLLTRIYAMGRDEQGELYVATNTASSASGADPVTGRPGGGIYKIVPEGTALTRRETWLQQYFFVGQYVNDLADLDGDSDVNLVEYAYARSPLTSNVGAPGLTITSAEAGPNTVFTVTFRRDPRAVDLTYRLQTCDDLIGWTTIAESIAGSVPSGTGFVSEADAAGEAPVKIVTVTESFPTPARRFARLVIIRQP